MGPTAHHHTFASTVQTPIREPCSKGVCPCCLLPVWRSDLEPGWSWDEDLEPYAEGATSCPLTHRELVISGTIRYLMDDGTEVVASEGDALSIPPGHRAWVVGDEGCVLIDWQTEPSF